MTKRAALELETLTVAYGSACVLSDVSLRVAEGELVALLGRNGAGKTTLLRTVMGLHKPVAGRVLLGGEDVTSLPASSRASLGIGYVPQGRGIFPHLTVWENLTIAYAAVRGRGRNPDPRMIQFVFELFPAIYQLRHRKGGFLSGGEQQQLAIARALLTEPKLLLLDEPTEGIQPSVVQDIAQALCHIGRTLNIAIMLVEQFLDFAWSIADRFYVLQRGRLVAEGETEKDAPQSVAHLLSV